MPAVGNCSVVARVDRVSQGTMLGEGGCHDPRDVGREFGARLRVRDAVQRCRLPEPRQHRWPALNVNNAGLTAPYWVKIVRNNNNFTAFRSSNGSNWTQVGSSVWIPMGSSCYIGIAATSHADGNVCTATIDSITAIP